MQKILIERGKALLESGTVTKILGWKKGIFDYDVTPFVFTNAKQLEADFVFNEHCHANLSKYMVKETLTSDKVAVFLKPCDTYSLNQLINEHRVNREQAYIIAIPCNAIRENNPLERCTSCKSTKHVCYDELIGETGEVQDSNRFDMVETIENMTADERFAFWQGELSRCIRCNACRNACPACTCEKCIFDNANSGVENKAAANSFEESMFHIIRAFHVAGRCTDCGECSRVCPEHIPLHLLNRKFIKDINLFYGEYQAGESDNQRSPLVSYEKTDIEPSIVKERGNGNA